MIRVAAVLLLLAVYIYGIIDVIRTPRSEARTLPKPVWLLLVVLLPVIGTVLWLFLGRTWTTGGGRRRRAPRAPDDDPNFLRQLDNDVWRQRMRRRRGEASDPA